MGLITIALVSLATGILASLGLGGGMVLIIYLTVFQNMPQLQAQGINLVFFVPIAIISIIMHSRNHLIEWKKTVPVLITGTIFVIIFSLIANSIDNTLLRKLFGVFIIFAGIKELFKKSQSHSSSQTTR